MNNKNYLIIGAVLIGIIVIAGGGFFFLNQNKSNDDAMMTESIDEEKMIDDDQAMSEDEAMMEGNEVMAVNSSRYIVHSNTALDETLGTKRVLFFYANWCPTCRPVDTELNENSDQIPDDVSVIRVNYNDPDTDNEEEELASTYGVTYQHTFVQIDENGKEVTRWSNGGLEELLENVQ